MALLSKQFSLVTTTCLLPLFIRSQGQYTVRLPASPPEWVVSRKERGTRGLFACCVAGIAPAFELTQLTATGPDSGLPLPDALRFRWPLLSSSYALKWQLSSNSLTLLVWRKVSLFRASKTRRQSRCILIYSWRRTDVLLGLSTLDSQLPKGTVLQVHADAKRIKSQAESPKVEFCTFSFRRVFEGRI